MGTRSTSAVVGARGGGGGGPPIIRERSGGSGLLEEPSIHPSELMVGCWSGFTGISCFGGHVVVDVDEVVQILTVPLLLAELSTKRRRRPARFGTKDSLNHWDRDFG